MNVCFNGCSFTVGEGFPESLREYYIYDRLLEQKFKFNRTNIAKGGSSNYTIFMRSADAILSGKYNCVITQWSALNRIWLSPGPDSDFFVNDTRNPDFRYREIYLNAAQKKTFTSTLLMLNHDYQNIFDLIDYCNILISLSKFTNTLCIFVNGLVPWESDLSIQLDDHTNFDKNLSMYTKNILDFDHRDDNEIYKFFTKLQHKFSKLDESKWVNIFNSFYKNSTDKGPQGHHPGPKSHSWMADQIDEYLRKNSIL